MPTYPSGPGEALRWEPSKSGPVHSSTDLQAVRVTLGELVTNVAQVLDISYRAN